MDVSVENASIENAIIGPPTGREGTGHDDWWQEMLKLCGNSTITLTGVLAAGFRSPQDLTGYLDFGIQPIVAARYKRAGLNAESYVIWRDEQFTADEAFRWMNAGMDSPQTASQWVRAAPKDALDLFESGFDLAHLPPVRQDRENSSFYGKLTVVKEFAAKDGLERLYARLIRVYACPTVTLRAARIDRDLEHDLFDVTDRVLRPVLVIIEHETGYVPASTSAETIRSLIAQFS